MFLSLRHEHLRLRGLCSRGVHSLMTRMTNDLCLFVLIQRGLISRAPGCPLMMSRSPPHLCPVSPRCLQPRPRSALPFRETSASRPSEAAALRQYSRCASLSWPRSLAPAEEFLISGLFWELPIAELCCRNTHSRDSLFLGDNW